MDLSHRDALFLRMAEICGGITLTWDETERKALLKKWEEIRDSVAMEAETIRDEQSWTNEE